jgi:Mn2+/Fe2+ NRAMP family transporter
VLKTFAPDTIDMMAIVTLVGGTVGGYITFSGGHRLIDAGVTV